MSPFQNARLSCVSLASLPTYLADFCTISKPWKLASFLTAEHLCQLGHLAGSGLGFLGVSVRLLVQYNSCTVISAVAAKGFLQCENLNHILLALQGTIGSLVTEKLIFSVVAFVNNLDAFIDVMSLFIQSLKFLVWLNLEYLLGGLASKIQAITKGKGMPHFTHIGEGLMNDRKMYPTQFFFFSLCRVEIVDS
jgi:hypothetical protein